MGKMKCLVGHNVKYDDKLLKFISDNHFTGLIGTIILFNAVFAYEIVKKFYEIGGEYETILYKSYQILENFSQNSEKISQRFQRIPINLKFAALEFFKNFDKFAFEEKVVMIISSKVIIY